VKRTGAGWYLPLSLPFTPHNPTKIISSHFGNQRAFILTRNIALRQTPKIGVGALVVHVRICAGWGSSNTHSCSGICSKKLSSESRKVHIEYSLIRNYFSGCWLNDDKIADLRVPELLTGCHFNAKRTAR